MAEQKTKETALSVDRFLAAVEDPKRREDCRAVLQLMREITGWEPAMWGNSIVGFGKYHYRYDSGREGEWFVTGFSPRKTDLSLYLATGFEHPPELMEKLGKYKAGRSCLYIKRLEDVDLAILRELISRAAASAAPSQGR